MNKKGTTLLELVVSITIFVILVIMAMDIGQSIIESLRNAVSAQMTQENVRFALEVMAKEMRNAKKTESGECVAEYTTMNSRLGIADISESLVNKVFNKTTGTLGKNILLFKNKHNECVSYSFFTEAGVNDTTIQITRSEIGGRHKIGLITSGLINIKYLDFMVEDDPIGAFHSIQPRATIMITAEMERADEKHKQETDIQTTVSARYYE